MTDRQADRRAAAEENAWDVEQAVKRAEQAPYPHEWTSEQRLDMTWWAMQHNVRVDYQQNTEDEGASGWYPVMERMERDRQAQAARIAALKMAGAVQPELPVETSEPQPYDTSEPRRPNPIGDW
jgi:hypothetical protein